MEHPGLLFGGEDPTHCKTLLKDSRMTYEYRLFLKRRVYRIVISKFHQKNYYIDNYFQIQTEKEMTELLNS